jgi:hypothetical protein
LCSNSRWEEEGDKKTPEKTAFLHNFEMRVKYLSVMKTMMSSLTRLSYFSPLSCKMIELTTNPLSLESYWYSWWCFTNQ